MGQTYAACSAILTALRLSSHGGGNNPVFAQTTIRFPITTAGTLLPIVAHRRFWQNGRLHQRSDQGRMLTNTRNVPPPDMATCRPNLARRPRTLRGVI